MNSLRMHIPIDEPIWSQQSMEEGLTVDGHDLETVRVRATILAIDQMVHLCKIANHTRRVMRNEMPVGLAVCADEMENQE